MATALDKFADRKPGWDSPVIIESHINGVRSKEMNPHTPVTYDEVVEDSIRLWDAGSCAIHVHNTNFDLRGEESFKDYMKAWDRILKTRPGITWYPTTCNNLECTEDQHGLEHLAYLHPKANVNIACLDPGIDLFANTLDAAGHIVGREYGWNYKRIAGQVDFCLKNKIAMVWGIYEPGYVRVGTHYVNRGMYTKGTFWDFYLVGDYGLTSMLPIGTCGMKPTLESLYYYLNMIEDCKVKLPWCVSIWGEGGLDTRPLIRRVIELGGHVKTGLELFYDPNRKPTNLQLLQEAQGIAREVGRPLATQQQAKEIYGIV